MAKKRIPLIPTELRDQALLAAEGIANEPNWPATAPARLDVISQADGINSSVIRRNQLKAQYDQECALLYRRRDILRTTMIQVDAVTDGLYTAGGAKKWNFGLKPKKRGGTSVPLAQVVITKIKDGIGPAAIFLDWHTIHGAAAYQVEWFSTSALSGPSIGNAAVSESEFEIPDLQVRQQYWIHVRAVRGNRFGPWSDPATRVANP